MPPLLLPEAQFFKLSTKISIKRAIKIFVTHNLITRSTRGGTKV